VWWFNADACMGDGPVGRPESWLKRFGDLAARTGWPANISALDRSVAEARVAAHLEPAQWVVDDRGPPAPGGNGQMNSGTLALVKDKYKRSPPLAGPGADQMIPKPPAFSWPRLALGRFRRFSPGAADPSPAEPPSVLSGQQIRTGTAATEERAASRRAGLTRGAMRPTPSSPSI